MPLLANLIAGSPARNHDFDFARRALLDALYAAGDIRTDCYQNYERAAAGDLLVSYTSQVPVSDSACVALRAFLEGGGRWFAIHASNSVRDNTLLPPLLGSRFITHPPYMHYAVSVCSDPLVADIAPFEVDDELYVIEQQPGIELLLYTHWGGTAMGDRSFPEELRPLMYRYRVGAGGVLYLALGHCNRPFDKPRPESPDAPDRRGPWAMPVYQELIRRGIAWAAHRL
jgi:type 1 glutamine amidotransferase